MTDRRRPFVSDAELRDALARRPDPAQLPDDLAAIVAAARRTRQERTPVARWMLVAAILTLAVLSALAGIVVLSRLTHPGGGLVVLDTDHRIILVDADGSEPRALTDGAEFDWAPLWAPDGTRFVYWAIPTNPATCGCVPETAWGNRRLMLVDMRDPAAPRTSLLTTVNNAARSRVSWAPDSRHLVVGDVINDTAVVVVVDTETLERTPVGPTDSFDPVWSPDGRHIAFARGHEDLANRGLYVMDPGGSNVRPLAAMPSRGAGFQIPVWSPSSDRLAFAAETTGPDPFQKDIWVVGLDGSPAIDISNNPADEQAPGWSPDGSRLAYVREIAASSLRFHLVVSASDGTGQAVMPQVVGAMTAAWSPDGKGALAVELGTAAGGGDRVIAIDLATRAEVVLADGHSDGPPSWQPRHP
jgi:Tol biopolymer transport system component